MEETSGLRQSILAWLEHARRLPAIPQTLTDVALATQPEFDQVINAVVGAAPRVEHRDLYGKVDGDWLPRWSTLIGGSGLGDATRLVAHGAKVPVEEVADSFVAFCTAPAPPSEDWLLLRAGVPQGTHVPLGPYTLQTFTADELRQMGPMPALHHLRPGALDLSLLADAPFLHTASPDRQPSRAPRWFGHRGPRAEAAHWRALLPLVLWSSEPLRVEAVFDVERGRRFGLKPDDVITTIQTHLDRYGMEEDVEVRETGSFCVTPAELPALKTFCIEVTARIDAVMDGITSDRSLPKKRARRLERAARHLLRAYQRTYSDFGVWEQEADELHLDYVIAIEALMISPKDKRGEEISKNVRTRASALFLTPGHRKQAQDLVQRAYSARSNYVHGDLLKPPPGRQQLEQLRELRLITRQIILRWLVLTPTNTEDLAPLLDTAAAGTDREHIDGTLRSFFAATPPHDLPSDATPG
ncbi:hypothetical protein [Streptomyces chartreusis]|uniref:hypothetical protein n=1 Tax=Streptomyces chartreusis TaxID=1969 RepID=UPI0033EDAE7E